MKHLRLKMNRLLTLAGISSAVICGSFVSGCTSRSGVSEPPVITAAKREAVQKWGWKKVEIEGATFEGGRWVVHLSMLPKTPGGHATIEVSEDGRIIDSRGGR